MGDGAAKMKAREKCSKKEKSDSGRLVTPLSHKVCGSNAVPHQPSLATHCACR